MGPSPSPGLGGLGQDERQAYPQAGLRLLGTGDSLFDTTADPRPGPGKCAVVRFMVAHGIDP